MKQVTLNLISNVMKYNEPGGQVILSTAVEPGGQAIIRARDTMGGDERERGRLRAQAIQPNRQNRPQGGVGLDLPLTKAVVEANGAEFPIKSRREHGTLIGIAFPVAQASK